MVPMDVYGFFTMLKQSTRSCVSFILKIRLEADTRGRRGGRIPRVYIFYCIFIRENVCRFVNLRVYARVCV